MRMIKMFLVCVFVIVFTGCAVNDNDTTFFYKLIPIKEVVIPEEFEKKKKYIITAYYLPPTNCHSFVGFDTKISKNEQTISIVNLIVNKNDCIENSELAEATFEFYSGNEEKYIFKFWQGEKENGDDQFLVIEVPVKQ